MKKGIFLGIIALLVSIVSYAQSNINAKRITVSDSIWVDGHWVKGFSNDNTMGNGADNILPTQGAVKGAIDNSVSSLRFKLDSVALLKSDVESNLLNFNYIGGSYTSPILTASDSGWDQELREFGNVTKINDTTLALIYSGNTIPYNNINSHIGIAYSHDNGKSFTKGGESGTGILPDIDSIPGEDGYMIQFRDSFYLYSEAKSDTAYASENNGIQLFTSSDLTHWSNKGVVFDDWTDIQPWELFDRSSPTIIDRNDSLFMLYEGRGVGFHGTIGLAISTDGYIWRKYQDDPVITGTDFEDSTVLWTNNIVPDDIMKIGEKYYLTFHAYDGSYFRNGIVVSKDLIHWSDYLGGYINKEVKNTEGGGGGFMFYYDSAARRLVFIYGNTSENKIYKGIGITVPQFMQNWMYQKSAVDTITGNWVFKNLEVNNSSVPTLRISNGNSGTAPALDLYRSSTNTGQLTYVPTGDICLYMRSSYATGKIRFQTNSSYGGAGSNTRMTIFPTGNIDIGTDTDSGYRFNVGGTVQATQFKLSDLNTAPVSATDTGIKGEIRITSDYIYVCIAANTWVRAALETW